MVGHCELMRWKEQTLQESIAWHTANGTTAQGMHGYKAGYEQGYMAAISALKLHKHLSVDKDK